MHALLYADWETLVMSEQPTPVPTVGEVLIHVEAAGICGSELEAVRKHSPRRTPPLILGHEFTGRIAQVGPGVDDFGVGQPVVANAVIACGACPPCRRGASHLCQYRTLFGMHRPGAFAEYVTAPASALLPRPEGVEPRAAALTEPLANGVHIAGLLAETAVDTVAVFGVGPIGLLAMQALKATRKTRIAVVDTNPNRLELAVSLGADCAFDPSARETMFAWAGEDGFAATVDAVGAAATKRASIEVLRAGGTAVWIGLHENESPLGSYDLILPEKRVLGSYACTMDELAQALAWIADDRVDVRSWTSEFPLARADHAFLTMLKPGPTDVKGVITNL